MPVESLWASCDRDDVCDNVDGADDNASAIAVDDKVRMALAVAAARAGARVLCLEGGSKPLRKVRVSGGGRCNVMHDATTWEARVGSGRDLLSERYPRGADQLLGAPARSECPLS